MLELLVAALCFAFAGGIIGWVICLNHGDRARIERWVKQVNEHEDKKKETLL